MLADTSAVRSYFYKLGLESEVADIYLALHAYGPQSISALARNSGVERTHIYRLFDTLKNSGLVEIEVHNKYSILRAAPITNVQVLISKKEQELRDLQTEFTSLHNFLNGDVLSSPATRVQFFQGLEGIKQMVWNQTKASGENLSILYENMQSRTKQSFFERWARTCNEAGITFRGIIGDHFIKTQQQWYRDHSNERLASWRSRFVPDDVFKITHSTIIYGNVTAYYNWHDDEVFGIEIANQEIAETQRAFFEMLWAQGVDVDDLKGLDGQAALPTQAERSHQD
jgi:sugar-specific transcriptional regulator TrmB